MLCLRFQLCGGKAPNILVTGIFQPVALFRLIHNYLFHTFWCARMFFVATEHCLMALSRDIKHIVRTVNSDATDKQYSTTNIKTWNNFQNTPQPCVQ